MHTTSDNATHPPHIAALNSLAVSPKDRPWLEASLNVSAAEGGTRAAFLQIIERYAQVSLAPEHWHTFRTARAHLLTAAPFSLIPVRDFIMGLVSLAHLQWPSRPLKEALRKSAEAITVEGLDQMPIFGSLYQACGGDPRAFFDLIAGTTMLWERGHMSLISTSSPDAIILRYEALPMAALAPSLEGFYRGFMKRLDFQCVVETDHISPTIAEIHLHWTPA